MRGWGVPPARTLGGLDGSGWLGADELRIGLGCMRLSTDDARDEARAAHTIAAAAAAGVTVFDTAHAYGQGPAELGHNERLLARSLRASGAEGRARIVTKGGMSRAGGGWVPDGRAKAIMADCNASLSALDGLPIDLYLIHAPDPRTPWRTSVRALARVVDGGLVARVGVSNVNRRQLDEALDLAPIAAVQVAVSVFDDATIRGGVLQRCVELGITVMAHSPLGGPRRAARVGRLEELGPIADTHAATPAEVALAWVLGLSPMVVAIPGARRPETVRSAVRAAALEPELDEEERAALDRAFGSLRDSKPASPAGRPRTPDGADVVLVMGIPGAGKSLVAREHVANGYRRLNRDERGGTLRELAATLDDGLSAGGGRFVLDNTYLTRASRSHVVEVASRHGVPARCVWLDTPLAQAQINLVERLLEAFGRLPGPDDLRAAARRDPRVLTPTSQMRTLRELEPPSLDEGFAGLERVPFVRKPPAPPGRPGVFVSAAALRGFAWREPLFDAGAPADAPHLVFEWSPDATEGSLDDCVAVLSEQVIGPVEAAVCPHPGGPPTCWCRPPLPGLLLAFARRHGIDPARSFVLGTGPAHRTLAAALGATATVV